MNSIKFWAAFAVGVAAGATVALMYAPQSGVKTRRQIRRGLEDASGYLKDATEAISDSADRVVRKGRDVVEDALASANSAVRRVVDLV